VLRGADYFFKAEYVAIEMGQFIKENLIIFQFVRILYKGAKVFLLEMATV
jgi:hypothetical protein